VGKNDSDCYLRTNCQPGHPGKLKFEAQKSRAAGAALLMGVG